MKKQKVNQMSEEAINVEMAWIEVEDCYEKLKLYVENPKHYTFDYLESLLDSIGWAKDYMETITLRMRSGK